MSTLSGGDKLEAYLRDMAAKVSNPGTLRVGFLEGAVYPDGTPVPLVAAVQEFGSPANGIPSRPFFRSMIAEKSSGWGDAIGETLKATEYDAGKALALMGEGIEGQLKESIIDFEGAPLSPATIAAKGSDKQLIDSGHLLNSTGWDIEKVST